MLIQRASVAIRVMAPILTLAFAGLAGCGQKGPLTLPRSALTTAPLPTPDVKPESDPASAAR
jgi:predicted small lipoprotein YifL